MESEESETEGVKIAPAEQALINVYGPTVLNPQGLQ